MIVVVAVVVYTLCVHKYRAAARFEIFRFCLIKMRALGILTIKKRLPDSSHSTNVSAMFNQAGLYLVASHWRNLIHSEKKKEMSSV